MSGGGRIAVTFDDAPREPGGLLRPDERTELLVAGLSRAGVEQAGFFVTVGNLERPHGAGGVARLDAYVAAGHVLGNHSWGHLGLSGTSSAAFLADLDRAEGWLRSRPGYRPWFRFPYLDEGEGDPVKRRLVGRALDARGLRNAYVTVRWPDYHLEALALRARSEGRTVDHRALGELFARTFVAAAEFYAVVARRVLGRDPVHVVLLHETDVAALFLPGALHALGAAGWTVVPADEAYTDPLAWHEPSTHVASGRVAALARQQGVPVADLVDASLEEPFLTARFADRVLER